MTLNSLSDLSMCDLLLVNSLQVIDQADDSVVVLSVSKTEQKLMDSVHREHI